jgi:hypothetical protein
MGALPLDPTPVRKTHVKLENGVTELTTQSETYTNNVCSIYRRINENLTSNFIRIGA